MKMKCPHCGISGKAPSSPAGRLVRCPRCTELFLLPELEETSPSITSPDIFALEEEGQGDEYSLSDSYETDRIDHGEEEILADESWLTGDFSDEVDGAEPEPLLDLSEEDVLQGSDIFAEENSPNEEGVASESEEELSDWTEDFDLEPEQEPGGFGDADDEVVDLEKAPEEGGESEELAFAETFGEELTEAFDYQELTDEMATTDESPGDALTRESDEAGKSTDYPDFSEDQVTWRDEHPEAVEGGDGLLAENEVVADEKTLSPQPSDDAIQENLNEMLATTCIACDNQVGEDELYCPDCMRKKEGDTDGSAMEAGSEEEGGKKPSPALGKVTKWGGIVVVSLALIGGLLYLSVQMGWV